MSFTKKSFIGIVVFTVLITENQALKTRKNNNYFYSYIGASVISFIILSGLLYQLLKKNNFDEDLTKTNNPDESFMETNNSSENCPERIAFQKKIDDILINNIEKKNFYNIINSSELYCFDYLKDNPTLYKFLIDINGCAAITNFIDNTFKKNNTKNKISGIEIKKWLKNKAIFNIKNKDWQDFIEKNGENYNKENLVSFLKINHQYLLIQKLQEISTKNENDKFKDLFQLCHETFYKVYNINEKSILVATDKRLLYYSDIINKFQLN